MKKLITLVLLVFISSVASAAWYNPMSWIGGDICKGKPYNVKARSLLENKNTMRAYKRNYRNQSGNYKRGWTKDEYTLKFVPNNLTSVSGNIYSAIHVDHVISTKEIWNAGGCNWNKEQRKTFKRDTSNFKVTSAQLNTSKGAAGPKGKWFKKLDDNSKIRYLEARYKVTTNYPNLKLPKFVFKKALVKHAKLVKGAKIIGKTGSKFFVVIGAATTGYEIYLFVEDPNQYIEDTKKFWSDITEWTSNKINSRKYWQFNDN